MTKDEVGDPNALRIQTTLNGATVQDANTNNMIFDVRTIVSFLSESTTLLPATLIFTGTPQGVGMGRKPQFWLKDGDEVCVTMIRLNLPSVRELSNRLDDYATLRHAAWSERFRKPLIRVENLSRSFWRRLRIGDVALPLS